MRQILRNYGIAVAAVGLTLLISWFTPLKVLSPTALFFAAVMVSSWYGGMGPGLVATGLSALAIDYFIIPPTFALVLDIGDLARAVVFILEAFLISWLNNRRKQLAESLREQNEALVAAHRHKDEFLAALAHELRTPLGAIRNGLEILRRKHGDDGPTRQVCEAGERQVRHVIRLIDDLLDLTRIAQGKVQLGREAVHLTELVDEAVAACRPLIEAQCHELVVALPPEAITLEADPTRLQQVLVNLLQNAAKYTDPGGHIRLTATREGRELILRVRDTGVGIPPELLPTVFDRYTQSRLSLDQAQGGVGIGLSLVRGLVELHEGTVEAHSDGSGQGSEFVVRLPCPEESRSLEPVAVGKGGRDPGSF